MEICKVPTLRLKALNKHTHIIYSEVENVIQINKYVFIDKCSSIIMQKMHMHTRIHMCAHTHTRVAGKHKPLFANLCSWGFATNTFFFTSN